MQYEYKHAQCEYGLVGMFSRQAFDARMLQVLNAHGDEGWELKGSFWDNWWHVHLLFGRPKPDRDPWGERREA